ncbi:MAG: DNA translocase FtsK [Dysgonamonadaceae bacterium]|jgi:S-DNA-T family DNA segregation ATPase FtsK/SpoIIIE|nr:DNA translocase FtsK [Dysgonamonadaceae bacterium]
MAKRKLAENTVKEKQTGEPSKIRQFFTSEVTHFITGLIILIFTIYTTLSLVSFFFTGAADQSRIEGLSIFHPGSISGIRNWTGTRGACLSNVLMNEWFGISIFFILLFFAFLGLKMMKVKYFNLLKSFILCSLGMIWSSIALAFFFSPFFKDTAVYIGGKHGYILSDILVENFGYPGTFFIILIVFVVIMAFVSARTVPVLRKIFTLNYAKKIPAVKLSPKNKTVEDNKDPNDDSPEDDVIEKQNLLDPRPNILVEDETSEGRPFIPTGTDTDFVIVVPPDEEYTTDTPKKEPENNSAENPAGKKEEEANDLLTELGPYDPKLDLSNYRFPAIDLLKKYDLGEQSYNAEEQNENKNKIIQTLENYGIKIKNIKATVGPTITLYEIIPEDGVRISKIRNLEDDIAMSLSALGIRIIAPMPGKGTIGIEVPNKDPQIVPMYSIIASKKFQESNFDLPIALGKTITNEVFAVDLCKMPHLLVAGATGQGKSVGLNAIITSLLYKKHPAELKFVLVDPKMVEFSIYSAIEKHYIAKLPDSDKPIITDFTKVIYTLNSLTKEMDDRYDLLMKANSRNIKEYNEKFINRRLNPMKGHKFMPYIVVIIDEFGDLIMTAGKEIELPIARIAQKARAVGIHMIIATQRPTTNIITGTIKANFPARVAFRVTSMIDSRTILDGPGANQLIGRGDLLFFQGSDTTRVQCAFVDTPEVERISKFIGDQQGYPTAFELPEYTGADNEEKMPGTDLSDRDPLFDEAARLIVIHQQGSTSLIQRKFSIGYNRAGRLMDQLETAGIVGHAEGSKPRQVFIQDEYHLEQLLNSLK